MEELHRHVHLCPKQHAIKKNLLPYWLTIDDFEKAGISVGNSDIFEKDLINILA